MKNIYKTIVLSDIHLGSSGSKAREVTEFLKKNICHTLILNGDIIDGWQLKKYARWKKKHTKFFKRVLKMVDAYEMKVIYLRGNHDDFLDHVLPLQLVNISVCRDYIHESNGKKYYVIHGDVFDAITTNLKWVAYLGDIGYTFLLWLNKIYNNYRVRKGLPYYSLSQAIKSKVKTAVNYVGEYEAQLATMGRIKKCDGIICGHIHQPAIKQIDGMLYMNSGDWVESLTALVETLQGEWKIVNFNDSLVVDYELEEEDDDEREEVEEKEYMKDLILLREEIRLRKISHFPE